MATGGGLRANAAAGYTSSPAEQGPFHLLPNSMPDPDRSGSKHLNWRLEDVEHTNQARDKRFIEGGTGGATPLSPQTARSHATSKSAPNNGLRIAAAPESQVLAVHTGGGLWERRETTQERQSPNGPRVPMIASPAPTPATPSCCGREYETTEKFCPLCGNPREKAGNMLNMSMNSRTSAMSGLGSGRWAVSASEIAACTEPTPRPKDWKSFEKRVTDYEAAGLPWGLAELLAEEDSAISVRVFLLDNSASTAKSDGRMLAAMPDRRCFEFANSSRWEEIKATAVDQSWWSARVGARAEFVVVNPLPSGRDTFVVDCEAGDPSGQVLELKKFLDCHGSSGRTPLVQRIQDIRTRLLNRKYLRDHVTLTIVTDGLPTIGDPGGEDATEVGEVERSSFVQELRTFAETFNSSLIIRLATDDATVIDYYNQIDDEVDLPLDILDDVQGESAEIHMAGNGWLTYTPMIHRIREAGVMDKLFDLLDERPLDAPEIATFLGYVLRKRGDPKLPSDPDILYQTVEAAVNAADLAFDGKSAKMAPPVSLKLLSKTLRKRTKPAGGNKPAPNSRSGSRCCLM